MLLLNNRCIVFFIFLAILLASCQKRDSWQHSAIRTGNKEFDAKRLTYPALSKHSDIEIEFLRIKNRLHVYLNVYSESIPSLENDQKLSLIVIESKGIKQEFFVERLEGGQRLRIPEESLPLFIKLLESHSNLILSAKGGYKAKIQTHHFKDHFKKLNATPLFSLPSNPIGIAL